MPSLLFCALEGRFKTAPRAAKLVFGYNRLLLLAQGRVMTSPAITPTPPYYAVIFTSLRTEGDNGYAEMAKRMVELASVQPGFLGFDTARQEIGISISYWSTQAAIKAWKENIEHLQAQSKARDWYTTLRVRICRVEREYGF